MSIVKIWTIQIARWRLARATGIPILDITAKTGIKAFAPNFGDVMAYKYGEMSEEVYTQIYLNSMEYSKTHQKAHWQALKDRSVVALACYCKSGVFCHRLLFADLMKNYLELQGVEVQMCGELLPAEVGTKAKEEKEDGRKT